MWQKLVKKYVLQPKTEIKIDDISVSDLVFKEIIKGKDITKYVIEEPSLNEIFVSKVGESYEK